MYGLYQNSSRITSYNVCYTKLLRNCPLNWEPSGTDFLSPCLEEIGLMQRILPGKEFLKWLKQFSPQILKKNFEWEVAKVSDRTDGHLVHLDGLNFSRAWNFYALST